MATAPAADSTFQQWTAMADLQIKFIDTLGNYKKNVAQGELTEAQARYQDAQTEELLTVVREKQDLVHQMELDLAALNRLRYQVQQRSAVIRDMVGKVTAIRRGPHLDPEMLTLVWQGYDFFMNQVPQDVLDKLMDEKVSPVAGAGSNFVLVRNRTVTCHDAPADCDNVLQLIDWIREMRYMPKVGTVAYREVTDAFASIGGAASPEIVKLLDSLDAMQKRTYDAWQPVQLLGLPAQQSNVPKPGNGKSPVAPATPGGSKTPTA